MSAPTIELSGPAGGPVAVPSGALDDLAARVEGRLLRAGDPGWDDAVLVWNGLAAKVPALVLQAASAGDVAAAVGFARDHGVALGVKGGGHNIAGTAIASGGLTIDLSGMRTVAVDPEARLAQVGPGCRLGDVDRATQAHGLATPLGFISEVGVAGLTLGGGLGYLTRRFGWTVDNLVEAEVVGADGQVRVASRDRHPDLFWGLRGGGGNLGVVTRFGDIARDLAPIRALGDPVVDLLASQPYTQLQSFLDGTEPKGHHYYWKTEFLAGLDDRLLAELRELFAACPIPEAELGLLHLGGALNERADDDGAVGNRDARYVLGVNGMWAPDEPDADRFRRWIRDAWTRLRPFSTGATYVNFQTGDEGDDRVRATYGANYDRLVEVKRRWDPGNLFRSNRNIRP